MNKTESPPPIHPSKVFTIANATTAPSSGSEIFAREPPLNAKKPNIKMNAPKLMNGTEWPGMGRL